MYIRDHATAAAPARQGTPTTGTATASAAAVPKAVQECAEGKLWYLSLNQSQ